MKKSPKPTTILCVSTVLPTQCGIATYTEDSTQALIKMFGAELHIEYCEITFNGRYDNNSTYVLPSNQRPAYAVVAEQINSNPAISLVHIQHEFGLFGGTYGSFLFDFLEVLQKPVVFTFHTVLPNPNAELRDIVQRLSVYASAITVMTAESKRILVQDYEIAADALIVIPHGTHLVEYEKTADVKKRLGLEQRPILSTFGLLSAGKSIETALYALPEIVQHHPNVLYLTIGKTHPNTIIEGEDQYRIYLESVVDELQLRQNVRFINEYLATPELLEYLKATDIYVFTSKDANQAVSGTFSYAMSCSCPVVASKIPHTIEVLTNEVGVLVDIASAKQYATAIRTLLDDTHKLEEMGLQAYGKSIAACWENTALKLQEVYAKAAPQLAHVPFNLPAINWDHIKALTFPLGVVQFSKIGTPDLKSGYTLDDNARALIAAVLLYENTKDTSVLPYILLYLNFITNCQQHDGSFLNYVYEEGAFEAKNYVENLEDANGRAIWALGKLIQSNDERLASFAAVALRTIVKALPTINTIQSPRAVAFAIKGLHAAYEVDHDPRLKTAIGHLAPILVACYNQTATSSWAWFENKLTYANSVLPESLMLASTLFPQTQYRKIAMEAMNFLLEQVVKKEQFKIISNRSWFEKGTLPHQFGEQPIEVCIVNQISS